MGREIKRVPVDFDQPMETIWPGYLEEERREPPIGDGWQVWETVSEGSPVTPVFATPEDLARYLSTVGDAWHQNRVVNYRPGLSHPWDKPDPLPTYEAALRFVMAGWGPSMMLTPGVGMTNAYGTKLDPT